MFYMLFMYEADMWNDLCEENCDCIMWVLWKDWFLGHVHDCY